MNNDITIDNVKTYWDKRPCNIRHSKAEFGTKQYFDEVEERKYFVEPHIPNFADFKKWKGKKVLEVGCGIGTDSINFARAGAKLTVVELSKESLEICKKRFAVYNLQAKFYLADAEHLSEVVPVEEYDLIYSFGVIHHTPKPRKTIEEILKFSGRNTELRIMLYAKYSTKNFLILLGLMQPEAQSGCPVANTYSYQDVRELLSGFTVTDIHKDHIFPYQIKAYKNYEYKLAFPWNILPKSFLRLSEKLFGWHLLITAKKG